MNLPGPGNYDNNHKQFGQDAHTFSIRGRPRDLSQDDIPGPGTYDAKDD